MNEKMFFDDLVDEKPLPVRLNKLSERFLSVEKNYNNVIHALNNEKKSIEEKYSNILKSIRDNSNKESDKLKLDLENNVFIWKVLDDHLTKWNKSKSMYFMYKCLAIVLGALFVFSGLWFLGIIVGGAGYFVFNQREKAFLIKIEKGEKLVKEGRLVRYSIVELGYDIKIAVEREANVFKKSVEAKTKSLSIELEKKEKVLIADKEKELFDLDEKRKKIMFDLNRDSYDMVNSIKDELERVNKSLDLHVETYNSNVLKWNSHDIKMGRDFVSSNIRIGSEHVKIYICESQYSIVVPKCIEFLNKKNIIFNCDDENDINFAIQVSHNIIARTLLALPTGKIKIIFIDPVELGGNAAPFTPLLREIYGGMVFTQEDDIEGQLTILTRAIENIIQKYLQDKFKDIAEYNYKTKEVPEPYRLLVVYNFPHNFSESATKKLLNIIKSGPKSGVHTILVNDKKGNLPYGINWEAFEGINISKINNNTNNAFKEFKYDDSMPFGEIVEYINDELPKATSIKVPFQKYIPNQNKWWKNKSHKHYSVPIGRHALEVQNLRFDNDDDNQALLIGKPGSGKSNLLHVIIINSLWKYSPDQLEIYLIDFKGGVEFMVYANKYIPHIKTIAIESEREFGLSVLEGVENELLNREKIFSDVGVQNIEQYHREFPNEKMPRILLIVDEFQEFFVEDDNIRWAIDEKYDRIIRKGRAFGINTIFASQTLSGNSINKSTKELIDIRIALMCSDSDTYQILDERNPAAKDISRPGEGIYNSENGKVEGNKRFQAFFIENEILNKTIESIIMFAENNCKNDRKFNQIVFRGSQKAIMEKESHPLYNIQKFDSPKLLRLWVGEPVAITDDIYALIRKQEGSNLLIGGANEEIGSRVICSSVVSVAMQHKIKSCKFYCFNFYNVDSEVADIPEELFKSINHNAQWINNREIKETMRLIIQEIDDRISKNDKNGVMIYLCFFSFQRGRAFRKDGFTMSEEGEMLAHILKEGPDVGVFTLMQVSTIDAFTKSLDDDLLKEFSQRIASQMNPDNSIKMIGNQKAAKLGNNRALYYDDNENSLVKFIPYEIPNFSWVAQLNEKQSLLT